MSDHILYYKMKIELASPMSVGSGENNNTDSDIILDSRGVPVIPATSIAGAFRHFIESYCDKSAEDMFGYTKGQDSLESKVRFYDAVLISDFYKTVRDGVGLENKVAMDSAKFDMEIAETNAEFETIIELYNTDAEETKAILGTVSALDSGLLRLGSKTTRGYGQVKATSLMKAEFVLPEDRDKWLDFSPCDYSEDKYYTDVTDSLDKNFAADKFIRLHLELKQLGAVSIRNYTVKNKDDILTADYVQLSTNDDVPVIPGTSWAGAFRQRFKEFDDETDFINDVWGYVGVKNVYKDNENKKTEIGQQISKITFSESRLSGGDHKFITRNSIDRFSAGTKDGALYKEKTYYNGKCTLDIDIKNTVSDLKRCLTDLSAVIFDLDGGYLSIGGLTSVGRGIFTVEKITVNGTDRTKALKSRNISEMTGGLDLDQ